MKNYIAAALMLLLSIAGTQAQNPTTLNDLYQIYVTALNGQTGSTAELYLNMKNVNPIATWICDLHLPEGITLQRVELFDARYPAGYNPQLTTTTNNDGSTKITCEGEEGIALTDVDGTIAVATVSIAADLAPGTYPVTLKDIRLLEPDYDIAHNRTQTTFNWTIEKGTAQYTISFNTDGGTAVSPITQDAGSTITPPANPTKEGYTFLGWDPTLPLVMPEADLTLTALWKINTYTVTLLSEGISVDNPNPTHGQSITVTIGTLPDCTFSTLRVNGTDVTAQVTDGTYTISNVTADITIEATFTSTVATITPTSLVTPFSSEGDLDFSDSPLEAYVATAFNKTTGRVTLVRVKDVPAGTGILLIGQPGQTYKVPYAASSSYLVNLLRPCLEGGAVAASEGGGTLANYIFDGESEELCFVPVPAAGSVSLPARSAYLQLPTSFAAAGVKVYVEFEDEVIDAISSAPAFSESGACFDLAGRRIASPRRGIFIRDGKKILVK